MKPKKPSKRSFFNQLVMAIATAIGLAVVSFQASSANVYPDRPITLIVGFPAGGAFDSVMRTLAEEMSKSLGQRVLIDNRAGAGGSIGTQAVMTAPADGYTLLAAGLQLATSPHLNKISYKPTSDVQMLGLMANVPVLLLVRADSPIKDAKDIVALGKKNGSGVTIGSGGVGTTGHFASLMVESGLKTPVLQVPYKGGSPGLLALIGGEIDMFFDQPSGALNGFIKTGKLRAVLVMQNQRCAQMPNIKSAAESGLPIEAPLRGWQGLALRSGTPEPIVNKLSASMAGAVASPAFQKLLQQLDLEPIRGATPDAAQKHYLAELSRWGQFIKKYGITSQ
jgi:tripartite-type tricarboxylate transporter receptor subunit TctC